jgi:uncharacterized protein YndB with AHSA1/START domain
MDMTPEPPDPSDVDAMRVEMILHKPTRRTVALVIGLLAAVVLYCSARALGKSYTEAFFCIPLFVGVIVGVLAPRQPIRTSLAVIGMALLIAIVTLREGVICCLFALPLVVPQALLGATCGAIIRRHVRYRKHRAGIVALLIAGAACWQAIDGAFDDPARHPSHHAASTIVIAAPPEQVFAALATRPVSLEPRWPWFIRVGLPMPSRFEIDRPGPDGRIRAVFSHGVARGHVTDWVPGRVLAFAIDGYAIDDLPFHITRLGRGPHYGLRPERVDDWLTITGVRFTLRPAAGGGTALSREVSWRRHLAPGLYFARLQQTIMQRGQDRLLELLRRRIEQPPPAGAPALAALPSRPRI